MSSEERACIASCSPAPKFARSKYYTYENEYNQPYTLVEFDVSRVLKGEWPGKELTITQMSGPSQDGTMGNIVSHTEHFHVDTSELLFLETYKGNLRIKNRFCIEEGMSYDANGFSITMSQGDALGMNVERNTDPRFSTIDMGTHVLYKHFSDSVEVVNADFDDDVESVEAAPAHQIRLRLSRSLSSSVL